MASGSFKVNTDNDNISGTVSWSSDTDEANNRSTVKVSMRLSRENSGYTTHGTGWFRVTINGTDFQENGKDFSLTYNSNTLMVSGSLVVNHNSDGTKKITIGWDGDSNVFNVYADSGTATLNTIPRESQLTGGWTWVAGTQKPKFTWTRYSSSFTQDIKIEVSDGSSYHTIDTVTGIDASSYTWTPTVDELGQIFSYLNNDTTNWNQASRITLTTKKGSTVIGTDVKTGGVSSPAETTITSSVSHTVGNSVALTFDEDLSSFTYNLTFKLSGTTIRTVSGLSSTTYTFNPSTAEEDSMYNVLKNAKSGTFTVFIQTYYDGHPVRDGYTKSGTATVSSSYAPLFSTIDYTDTNSTTLGLTSPYQGSNKPYIIQNQSTLQGKVVSANKAVAQKSATITKYVATINGVSLTVNAPFPTDLLFSFNKVNASSNQTLTITAYDSRGYSKSVKMTVNIVPWAAPKVNAAARRQNGFNDATDLFVNGTISPVKINGTNINSIDVNASYYKWRVTGGTFSANTLFASISLTMPNFTTPTTAVNGATGLAGTSSWEVQTIIKDKFTTTTVSSTVGKGVPLYFIDLGMKAVGINKFPTSGYDLDVAGKIQFGGGKTNADFDMNNKNLLRVNHMTINDTGGNEGIEWIDPTNNWKIFVSPDDASNATGAMQFFNNGVRQFTIGISGNIYPQGTRMEFQAGAGEIRTAGTLTLNDITDGVTFTMGKDGTGTYIQSQAAYDRTYTYATNMYVTSAGTIGRSTSAARYKLDVDKVELEKAKKLLSLDPKTWYDRHTSEAIAAAMSGDGDFTGIPYLDRVGGMIAEEVLAAGLKEYVLFGDKDGSGTRPVTGLAYDRLWTLLVPIIRDILGRVEALEGKVNVAKAG